MSQVWQTIKKLKEDSSQNAVSQPRPPIADSLKSFGGNASASLYFIFSEKENIVFAFLQFVFVMLGYFLWVQMLDWISQDVWDKVGSSKDFSRLINTIFVLWSFLCVAIVTYPLGLLTACFGASYVLRFSGKQSTVADCLKIVMNKSWTLWLFSLADGWWTVKRILERLPKKNDRTSPQTKLWRETVYQAWKLATLGFIPAVVCGRGAIEAGKDSLLLLKDRFLPLAKLRLAYSLICWFFAIACYVGMIFLYPYLPINTFGHNKIYTFYVYAGFPLMVTLAFIMLIFRPLYIISAFRIYAFYAREKGLDINLPHTLPKVISSLLVLTILLILLAVVIAFREQLGIAAILAGAGLTVRILSPSITKKAT